MRIRNFWTFCVTHAIGAIGFANSFPGYGKRNTKMDLRRNGLYVRPVISDLNSEIQVQCRNSESIQAAHALMIISPRRRLKRGTKASLKGRKSYVRMSENRSQSVIKETNPSYARLKWLELPEHPLRGWSRALRKVINQSQLCPLANAGCSFFERRQMDVQ